MEFLSGVIATLFFGFIGRKIYLSYQAKQARKAYIPPSPRPDDRPRDFPNSNDLP